MFTAHLSPVRPLTHLEQNQLILESDESDGFALRQQKATVSMNVRKHTHTLYYIRHRCAGKYCFHEHLFPLQRLLTFSIISPLFLLCWTYWTFSRPETNTEEVLVTSLNAGIQNRVLRLWRLVPSTWSLSGAHHGIRLLKVSTLNPSDGKSRVLGWWLLIGRHH